MAGGIFLQLDVDYASNRDVALLRRFGRDTAAVRDFLVQCWCYCKRHKSDGHVPAEEIGLMVYPDSPKVAERRAANLVEVGIAVRTEDGYFFPDFLKRNKSRAQIDAESERKAAIGKKGGERSGEVRRAKADAKQGGSTSANTEPEAYTEPQPEPQTGSNSEGGNRPVTLRVVADTEPPQERTSTCTRHPYGNPADENCHGCKADKEHREREAERAAEQTRRDEEARARDCDRCDGSRVIDPETKLPTRRRCDHRRTA